MRALRPARREVEAIRDDLEDLPSVLNIVVSPARIEGMEEERAEACAWDPTDPMPSGG